MGGRLKDVKEIDHFYFNIMAMYHKHVIILQRIFSFFFFNSLFRVFFLLFEA